MHKMKNHNFILILGPIDSPDLSVIRAIWHDLISDSNCPVKISFKEIIRLPKEEQVSELQSLIEPNKINHIIFSRTPSFVNKLPRSLEHLRKICNGTITCYLLDAFNRLAYENAKMPPYALLNKFRIFDKVYTFSWFDHITYNFNFVPTPIRYLDFAQPETTRYDVFFIGRNKGRGQKLKKLADYFERNNVSYLFLLLKDANDPKVEYYKNIKFVPIVAYEDMITEYVANSRCLLSLCSQHANAPTLAYYESIIYKKKLLTDATIIESMPFTNINNQKVFSFKNLEDISIEWLKSDDIDSYCSTQNDFKPYGLFEHIANDYNLYNYKYNFGPSLPILGLHFSNIGWQYYGIGSGVLTKKRLESVSLINVDAEVSVYQDKYQWQISSNGMICGKTGECLPIKAIKISSKTLSIMYRVFIPIIGWTKWARDGEICGFSNLSENNHPDHVISGIQITTCPK